MLLVLTLASHVLFCFSVILRKLYPNPLDQATTTTCCSKMLKQILIIIIFYRVFKNNCGFFSNSLQPCNYECNSFSQRVYVYSHSLAGHFLNDHGSPVLARERSQNAEKILRPKIQFFL